ncbi:MAG TPA: TatD family hydrolase [Vulgatibacter sp.]|nr:TatD family hydrolase [Vulgatibacter sp.]
MMELLDSHAHVDASAFAGETEEVLRRAEAAGVTRLVCVGLWHAPGDFGGAHGLAAAHPGRVFASAGVHPHDVARVPEEDWTELERLAALPATIAVGETGLDYHYDHSPREEQRRWFAHQLELASRVEKPAIVHTREADDDTVAILREAKVGEGVIHCFTGDPGRARVYLDMGLHLSIPGVVTFKNAEPLRDAVRMAPLDRMLIETDCPYLAPIPHRGKRNEPAYVRLVAEKVAELKGIPVEEVAEATTRNAVELFRLG